MPDPTAASPSVDARVHRCTAFVHVADVDGSLAFYASLGFTTENAVRGPDGRAFWAMAASRGSSRVDGPARIMFALASGPIDPAQQAVLFYMYCNDVRGLRAHLLANGVADGGVFRGRPGPNNGRRVVFGVTTPDYMPEGEIRVADPDGYCILVGQAA